LRGIHVNYTKLEQQVATDELLDLKKLNDYPAGQPPRQAFFDNVLARYAAQNDIMNKNEERTMAGIKEIRM
jgi:hypothetical protein